MRDIKFRGIKRNPYGDSWVYGYYALQDGKHVIILPHSNSYEESLKEGKPLPAISIEHEIDYSTIGQYTGLKDKNGVEIYEGDIAKVDVDTAIVQYSDEDSAFILKPSQEYYFDSPMLAHNIDIIDKVIGNIYDNKELLGE